MYDRYIYNIYNNISSYYVCNASNFYFVIYYYNFLTMISILEEFITKSDSTLDKISNLNENCNNEMQIEMQL